MEKISIIVPCYNEEQTIRLFYREIQNLKGRLVERIELIFVDDGSRDGTLNEIISLAARDQEVFYISFSRNFGKEAAMLAGLRASTGDYVTIMDADLQHPPLLLVKMLKVLKEEDCDCVGSYHIKKGEEIRSKMIDWFYPIFNCFSSVKLHPNAKDFQLMRRPMVEAILSLNEQTPFLKVQTEWVGFQKKWVGYEEIDRCAGKTKFSMWNLLIYALQAFVNYSYFFLIIPWAFCLLGMFSKIFMVLGIFSCFGICLLYLNQILEEVRKRPKYIIKKTNTQMARWGNGIPRDC